MPWPREPVLGAWGWGSLGTPLRPHPPKKRRRRRGSITAAIISIMINAISSIINIVTRIINSMIGMNICYKYDDDDDGGGDDDDA